MLIGDLASLRSRLHPLVNAVLFLLLAVVIFSDSEKGAASAGEMSQRTHVTRFDPNDSARIQEWALGICKNRTVAEVAAPLGIPARIEDVVAFLTKGLGGESKKIVREICEKELQGA